MKKQNLQYLRMIKRIIIFLFGNKVIWKDNKAMETTINNVETKYTKITNLEQQQQIKIVGYAEKKKKQKRKLVVLTDIIASAIRSYAFSIDDDVLLRKVDISRSEFQSLKDLELENFANTLITLASSILVNLTDYGVTEETLKTYSAEIKSFINVRSEPVMAIKKRKTATESIKTSLKELRPTVKLSLDSFMKQYETSHPDFYHEYLKQREIVDAPTHKLSLKGIVTDKKTKEPLLDVIVTIPKLKLETETSEHGNYQFKNINRGTYKIEFQREGYKSTTLSAEILDNQTTDMDLEMERF